MKQGMERRGIIASSGKCSGLGGRLFGNSAARGHEDHVSTMGYCREPADFVIPSYEFAKSQSASGSQTGSRTSPRHTIDRGGRQHVSFGHGLVIQGVSHAAAETGRQFVD